jgi:hypothetical protein
MSMAGCSNSDRVALTISMVLGSTLPVLSTIASSTTLPSTPVSNMAGG